MRHRPIRPRLCCDLGPAGPGGTGRSTRRLSLLRRSGSVGLLLLVGGSLCDTVLLLLKCLSGLAVELSSGLLLATSGIFQSTSFFSLCLTILVLFLLGLFGNALGLVLVFTLLLAGLTLTLDLLLALTLLALLFLLALALFLLSPLLFGFTLVGLFERSLLDGFTTSTLFLALTSEFGITRFTLSFGSSLLSGDSRVASRFLLILLLLKEAWTVSLGCRETDIAATYRFLSFFFWASFARFSSFAR